MRVILYELKKIFKPARALAVLLFIILFFSFYIYEFCINDMSTNGTHQRIEINRFIHENYGAVFTPEERVGAEKRLLKHFKNIVTERIKNDEVMKAGGAADYDSIYALMERNQYVVLMKEGVTNFEEYGLSAFDKNKDYSLTEAEKKAVGYYENLDESDALFDMRMVTNANETLLRYDRAHDGKDYRINNFLINQSDSAKAAHLREIMSGDDFNGTISSEVTEAVYKMVGNGMLMIVSSIFILLAPVITADNISGLGFLQNTSKTGRSILKKQFAAYLLAAAFLTAVQLGAMFISLYFSSAGEFFDCKMFSFLGFNFVFSWFKGTLLQYIAVMAGLICLLCCVCTAAVFMISKISKNYTSLLMKAVPLSFLLTAFGYLCTNEAFDLSPGHQFRNWYYFIPVPFIEVYFCAALFIGFMTAAIIVLKRNEKREILM